jgi:hypothetical protein
MVVVGAASTIYLELSSAVLRSWAHLQSPDAILGAPSACSGGGLRVGQLHPGVLPCPLLGGVAGQEHAEFLSAIAAEQ